MADFATCIPFVLEHEGGFQNNPNDAGNFVNELNLGTKFGISAPMAVEYGWDPNTSLQSMTEDWASSVWQQEFWPGLEGINDNNIAAKILDMRASGKARADKAVQTALIGLGWQISADGVIGPETTSAINQEDATTLMTALCQAQANIYQTSAANYPNEAGFLPAWLERASDIPGFAIAAGGLGLAGLAVVGLIFWKALNT
jgi:lysozyme family protein